MICGRREDPCVSLCDRHVEREMAQLFARCATDEIGGTRGKAGSMLDATGHSELDGAMTSGCASESVPFVSAKKCPIASGQHELH